MQLKGTNEMLKWLFFCRAMWAYINGLNHLLKEVADFAKKDPNTIKMFLKRPPAKG